jgi:Flp pilus assembly protein TadB
MVTSAVLVGALLGLGIYAIVRALAPGQRSPVSAVARIDALRARGGLGAGLTSATTVTPHAGDQKPTRLNQVQERSGEWLAELYLRRGWVQRSLRADLALVDRTWESFLANKIMMAALGLFFGPFVFAMLWVVGIAESLFVPLWLALGCALLFFFLPDLEVRGEAAKKRRAFRRVVGAYLNLVAMSLAGGRGLPEALKAASEISDGWALRRIRTALADARITGISQWQALGRLGVEVGVEELSDLGNSLALVADDGAKVRESLGARAETMRSREMAEIEGGAGEKSQSMLVAQLLLCAGFLVFLIFPAAERVFGGF